MHLSPINISSNLDAQFDQLAKVLLNKSKIVVNNFECFFTEIEFYLFNEKKHPDPFVHQNPLQLNFGTWYAHGSGLDITIGNKAEAIWGGVLIRGIKHLNSKKEITYTDGPLNVIRELFKYVRIDTKSQVLGISILEKPLNNTIVKTTRVGLNPKEKPEGLKYKNKKYRYLIDLKTIHKYKEKETLFKNHITI